MGVHDVAPEFSFERGKCSDSFSSLLQLAAGEDKEKRPRCKAGLLDP
jgi:hypothetical protein